MSEHETYNKLVEHGLSLFLEHGYAACGINRILKQAQVPKGSFYHFFPDGKASLAVAVIGRYAALAADERQASLLRGRAAPLRRLRRHFTGFADHFEAQAYRHGCLLGNLSAELADHDPAVRAALTEAFSAWEDDVAAVLGEAKASGALPPRLRPDSCARFLVQSWEGALLRMKADKSRRPLDDFIELVFGRMLQAR